MEVQLLWQFLNKIIFRIGGGSGGVYEYTVCNPGSATGTGYVIGLGAGILTINSGVKIENTLYATTPTQQTGLVMVGSPGNGLRPGFGDTLTFSKVNVLAGAEINASTGATNNAVWVSGNGELDNAGTINGGLGSSIPSGYAVVNNAGGHTVNSGGISSVLVGYVAPGNTLPLGGLSSGFINTSTGVSGSVLARGDMGISGSATNDGKIYGSLSSVVGDISNYGYIENTAGIGMDAVGGTSFNSEKLCLLRMGLKPMLLL